MQEMIGSRRGNSDQPAELKQQTRITINHHHGPLRHGQRQPQSQAGSAAHQGHRADPPRRSLAGVPACGFEFDAVKGKHGAHGGHQQRINGTLLGDHRTGLNQVHHVSYLQAMGADTSNTTALRWAWARA